MKLNEKNFHVLNSEYRKKFVFSYVKKIVSMHKFELFKNPVVGNSFAFEVISDIEKILNNKQKDIWFSAGKKSTLFSHFVYGVDNPDLRKYEFNDLEGSKIQELVYFFSNLSNTKYWRCLASTQQMDTKEETKFRTVLQQKLFTYFLNQQQLSNILKLESDDKFLNLEYSKTLDDPLNFVRDLIYKINYEGLKKCLGMRSLVYKHLKNEEEFQLCMDYLRSHNFFT